MNNYDRISGNGFNGCRCTGYGHTIDHFLFARPIVNVLFVKEFALAVPVTLIPYLGISVRWFNVMLLPLVFLERIIAEDCNALIVLLRIVLFRVIDKQYTGTGIRNRIIFNECILETM